MDTKSILLAVAEPQLLVDITQALGAGWDVTSVASEADAVAQFEKRSFHALIVDFNLGSPDASDLLNQVLEKRPETVRFLLAYEADLALVAAKVLGTPQILPKPIERGSLKSRIEAGVEDAQPQPVESSPAPDPGEQPATPSVYAEVLKLLESPEVTAEQVGEVIASDEALLSEVLRLTNSAYLGVARNVTDPAEAVEALGLEAIKGIVHARQFLLEHSRLKPGYLSFDDIWEHSVNVAQIARDLVLFETKDRTLASQALTAGLLHDLGKIVLVTNFDDLYGRVNSLARKQPVSLWDIEKEMFGANHGEIGGCLLGMWNMSSEIVEAAALHHEPLLGDQQQLTPLAAVHIANVLERELSSGEEGMLVPPIINTTFLNQLGLLQRLPIWRAAFANRRAADAGTEIESDHAEQSGSRVTANVPESHTENYLPGPVSATRTTSSAQPGKRDGEAEPALRFHRGWVYGGITAAILFLALWFRAQPDLNQTEPIYARTPARSETPAVVPAVPAPDPAPAPAEQASRTAVAPESTAHESVAASTPNVSVAEPPASLPAAEPTAAASTPAVATNVPVASVLPPQKARAEFKVNAIIYNPLRPSAIVNGQTVSQGDQVNNATVVKIGPTAVTLQIDGQRKTYSLR